MQMCSTAAAGNRGPQTFQRCVHSGCVYAASWIQACQCHAARQKLKGSRQRACARGNSRQGLTKLKFEIVIGKAGGSEKMICTWSASQLC